MDDDVRRNATVDDVRRNATARRTRTAGHVSCLARTAAPCSP